MAPKRHFKAKGQQWVDVGSQKDKSAVDNVNSRFRWQKTRNCRLAKLFFFDVDGL
jgi:hypothetical protein